MAAGPRIAGLVAGALAFVAYLPGLGRSLDFDSAETVGRFVRPGPPWAVFGEQAVFNNHPLFSFLEQLVRVVTGRSDAAAMRVLPILCGALAVGVLTWFVARRHGLAAGLAAGAVLACNPTFVHLSRAVRGYSLLTLCAIVATIVVAEDRRAARRRRGRRASPASGDGGRARCTWWPRPSGWRPTSTCSPCSRPTSGPCSPGVSSTTGGGGGSSGRRSWPAAPTPAWPTSCSTPPPPTAAFFRADMPWQVATMVTGGGWASLALAPLVVAGAWVVLRGSRGARGAAIALAVVLLVLWAGLRSAALEDRFFVWLVPGAAYLVGVAVARVRAGALLAAAFGRPGRWLSVAPGYTADLTGYRAGAAVLRAVAAAGETGCVAGSTGVQPMLAYLDQGVDFTAVTDPSGLDGCDVLVVATWWPTTADWFAQDRRVIDAAEARYAHRLVIDAGDPALVLSDGPLPAF